MLKDLQDRYRDHIPRSSTDEYPSSIVIATGTEQEPRSHPIKRQAGFIIEPGPQAFSRRFLGDSRELRFTILSGLEPRIVRVAVKLVPSGRPGQRIPGVLWDLSDPDARFG